MSDENVNENVNTDQAEIPEPEGGNDNPGGSNILILNDGRWVYVQLNAGSVCDRIQSATGMDLLSPEQCKDDLIRIGSNHPLAREVFFATYAGVYDREDILTKCTPIQLTEAVTAAVVNFIRGVNTVIYLSLLEQIKAQDMLMVEAKETIHQAGEALQAEFRQSLEQAPERMRLAFRKIVDESSVIASQDT